MRSNLVQLITAAPHVRKCYLDTYTSDNENSLAIRKQLVDRLRSFLIRVFRRSGWTTLDALFESLKRVRMQTSSLGGWKRTSVLTVSLLCSLMVLGWKQSKSQEKRTPRKMNTKVISKFKVFQIQVFRKESLRHSKCTDASRKVCLSELRDL